MPAKWGSSPRLNVGIDRIDDRVGALQAEFEAARDLALVGGLRDQRLGLDGVARLGAVLVVERHFTAVFVRGERRLGHEGPFSGFDAGYDA